jgi:hypothetical protein
MRARFELSLVHFHRRHQRGVTLMAALGLVRGKAAARFLRDRVRYLATPDPTRRAELAADLEAWRQVLKGSRSV